MKKINFLESYGLYINGKWQPASDDKTIVTSSPSDGSELSKIAEATKEDVNLAVQSAQAAFETWKLTTPKERALLLNKIADIIENNKEHLATVESMDNGKPIRETMNADVPRAAAHFRYFAACILADEGSSNILDGNKLSVVLKEPIGVVGQIVPWNFPLQMAAWKLAPALAAGCTSVLKPSSETSLSVLEFVRLIEGVLPPGVINIITGSGSKSGQYILDHEGFSKLAFTGSTEVGLAVAKAAADKLIPATLELGGKSANIIFEDSDFDLAMDGFQMGIFYNQGQVCCAGSRIFVQDTIYDKFVQEATKRLAMIKVGDPLDPETQMGSQINSSQINKVLTHIDFAKKEGCKVAFGGEKVDGKGNFLQPTMVIDVKNEMKIAQEEVFGPVASIIKFSTEEEVIKMANDSEFGLAGAVWTKDVTRAIRVARQIEAGRIWVNAYNANPEGAPFGGYKKSGIGRETHKVALEHYSQTKNIMINFSGVPSGLYPVK
jgi:acyl-CoA reductase-like NAD-dependent aldehyde dehydrogenase